MARVYVGLGSNIDPEKNLKLGVRELRWRYGDIDLSPAYVSAPLGFEGDDFVNLVAGFNSSESPENIQRQIEFVHDLAGRNRTKDKFVSRSLDIDLLLYDDLVMDGPKIRLPRADVLDYSFVLRPLSELDPERLHPVSGRSLAEHWQEFDADSHPLQPVDVIL